MTAATDSDNDHLICPETPDSETIRRRLAVVITEADVLRAQLKVSMRAERERDRLHSQRRAKRGGCRD
jgi:hypothetical protein